MIASTHSLGTFTAADETGTEFSFDSSPGPASVTVSCDATYDGSIAIQIKNGDGTGSEWIEYATHAADGFTEINAPYQHIRCVGSTATAGNAYANLCWIRS